ncbi:hypothetical protein [Bradyrhizobium sp. USDA 4350]
MVSRPDALGERLESEATALTAALHAFFVLDIGAHETADETDIESADFSEFL